MARPSKINETKLLEHLKAGISDTDEAKEIGVTREAVRQKRKKFENKGLLPKRAELKLQTKRERPQKITAMPTGDRDITLDKIEEFLIAKLEDAAEVKHLRNRLAATETLLKNREIELEELKRYHKDKEDKRRRFQLAVQQGEIKTLL